MLELALFGSVAVGVPYLVRRWRSGVVWGLVAYLGGLLSTFLVLFAALLAMALSGVPSEQANQVFGPFSIAEMFGPFVGVALAGRRAKVVIQPPAQDAS